MKKLLSLIVCILGRVTTTLQEQAPAPGTLASPQTPERGARMPDPGNFSNRKEKPMLPEKPKFRSATPIMNFAGQKYQAVLLSHIHSEGSVQYDSVLLVSDARNPHEACLIITLECDGPDQPL